jgi:hypothetical protein
VWSGRLHFDLTGLVLDRITGRDGRVDLDLQRDWRLGGQRENTQARRRRNTSVGMGYVETGKQAHVICRKESEVVLNPYKIGKLRLSRCPSPRIGQLRRQYLSVPSLPSPIIVNPAQLLASYDRRKHCGDTSEHAERHEQHTQPDHPAHQHHYEAERERKQEHCEQMDH